jgi:hypothetical protein
VKLCAPKKSKEPKELKKLKKSRNSTNLLAPNPVTLEP